MNDSKNRQWILEARPTGHLTGNEFRWNETAIRKPTDGQALVRNLWLSFDPTQRNWMARDSYVPKIPLGDVMRAAAVGQVVESQNPDFKRGDLVSRVLGLAGLHCHRRQGHRRYPQVAARCAAQYGVEP